MSSILHVVQIVFWGVLTLSILVFVHEGGHFLAARACGVRVTEFFLGLPCKIQLSHTSKRIGTKFGITPILLGGYAAVCGMEPSDSPNLSRVLNAVHRLGRANVAELSKELDLTEDEILDACEILQGWGSIVPFFDSKAGVHANSGYLATTYLSQARDKAGLTHLDGRNFDAAAASSIGDPWTPSMGADIFFESERSHTYQGKGFFKRMAILLAGIFVNIVTGFLFVILTFSVVGTEYAVNSNQIASVQTGSVASEAGIAGGDTILAIGDTEVSDWNTLVEAIDAAANGAETTIVFQHDGKTERASICIAQGGVLGITAQTETYRLSIGDSIELAASYIRLTAESIAKLFVPQETVKVLENSTSIVGISVMSYEAASSGLADYLFFAALISFSLGFMNLLPIPPLDGGKALIEIVRIIIRREVPLKVQTAISYVGVGLFLALFIYMLRADIIRFIL